MKLNYPQTMSLVFIIAKILGYINWSWWTVFIPIYIVIFFEILTAWEKKARKRIKKEDQLTKDMLGKS